MNRRAFLGTLLGAGAVVATEAVAPSLVWPFRKYFLPSNWMRWWAGYDWAGNFQSGCIPPGSMVETNGFTHLANNGIYRVTDSEVVLFDKALPDLRLAEEYVEAIELEAFAKEIPDLIYKSSPTWKLFKSRERTAAMQQFQESVDRLTLEKTMRLNVTLPPPPDMPITVKMEVDLEDRWRNLSKRERSTMIFEPENPKRIADIHTKATVENIVRFVDDLQKS